MPYLESNGLRLHYRQSGAGPLVVLLPGNTASSAHFKNEIDRLQANYQVVGLDYRGTGMSDRLDNFDVDWQSQCAEDVAALINHVGAGQAILIGTSGGAVIALLCAAQFPDLVRAVLADSFVPRWSVDMLQTRAGERLSGDQGAATFWEAGHGADWQRVVDADTRWLQQVAAGGGLDITAYLARVRCPVLLTGTLTDSMLPDIATQMLAALRVLPHGELYLCRQGDHPLIWSAPDQFWAVCAPFLKRIAHPMQSPLQVHG